MAESSPLSVAVPYSVRSWALASLAEGQGSRTNHTLLSAIRCIMTSGVFKQGVRNSYIAPWGGWLNTFLVHKVCSCICSKRLIKTVNQYIPGALSTIKEVKFESKTNAK